MPNTAESVNLTVDNVLAELESIDSKIEQLKQQRLSFEADLSGFISGDVSQQLANKDYGCGTANVETPEFKVKVVVTKKVKWNELQLATIYNTILASGENPSDYIKTSYDVSETAYKAWPEKISKVFQPARTVEASKPKITFERKK